MSALYRTFFGASALALLGLGTLAAPTDAFAKGPNALWYRGNSASLSPAMTRVSAQVRAAGASSFVNTTSWPSSMARDYGPVFVVEPRSNLGDIGRC